MKVTYKPLTVDEAFELVKQDAKRDDLFFESASQGAPQVLANLRWHKLEFVDFCKLIWFKREVEDGAE